MKILITKINNQQCKYTITRDDGSVEQIVLDLKTYLLHDICHYVVEKHLGYKKGFWGMLAQGHSFRALLGKENTLTEELRFIEKIVGPIQAVYSCYFPKQDLATHIAHLNFDVKENVLENSLAEIKNIVKQWDELTFDRSLELDWV